MAPQNDLEAKWNEATLLHKAGQPAEAEFLYLEILALNPRLPPAWNMLALARLQQGRMVEALAACDQALAVKPDFAEALTGRARILMALGRFDDAVTTYNTLVRLNPADAEAWNYRGGALSFLGRTQEAMESFAWAIAVKPDYLEALNNYGATAQALKRFTESLESFDRALALKPDHPEALSNRGVTLSEMGRYPEALASIEKSLAARPARAEVHYNRAGVLADLGRFEDALAAYDRAVALKPDYAEAHYNQSLCLLLLGRFETGWRHYEWRKRRKLPMTRHAYPQPHWLGNADISGKRVLLYWEQGLGDTIQFCRYAPAVAAKGAKLFLCVQAPLAGLLKQFEPALEVIGEDAAPAQFDSQCSLMSLPLATGLMPAAPYLKSDAALAHEWASRLPVKTKPRIGLAWSGGADHKDDRNRSMALETLLPLLTPQAEWTCLQKEIRPGDLAAFDSHAGIGFFGEAQKDFADTAALIDQLDLVISVDTAVAHLAGAMGKPTWILLPWRPDWRWQLERSDSPWYPSARLFRQPERGDWTSVVARVSSALADL